MTVDEPQVAAGKSAPSSMRFRVTERMAERFAQLTGDRSALHVNDEFARRSVYRQPVVHGVLPVVCMCLAEALRYEGRTGSLRAIACRFSSPVYANDVLELHLAGGGSDPGLGLAAFDFSIVRVASNATVTTGTVSLAYRHGFDNEPAPAVDDSTATSLVRGALTPLSLDAEQITKGRSEAFGFVITDDTIRALRGILAEGQEDAAQLRRAEKRGGLDYAGFLGITLFSTMVGMRLPGNYATFLELSAELPGNLQRGKVYRLKGVVTHISRATRILKAVVTAAVEAQGATAEISGKVAALVNKPGRAMPSMAELRASAMDWGLRDKAVLITGASRGIGETIAKLLALHGARVTVNYHRGRDDAERVVKEIRDAGGQAVAVQADVTQPAQVARLVLEAQRHYGPIHVLVNNAVRDFRPIPFLRLSWDDVQLDLDVIVKGAFNTCKEVIPVMLAAGGGKIINISSVAVESPPRDQAKYVMAKSALVGLTRSLSVEYAAQNILANLVVPSFVETDLVSHIQEGFRKKIAQESPMRRLGSPIDVAQAVLFLASAHSSFTTGQKIMVTGGDAPFL